MTEVSARLRAARERAGLTIADVSASTKIRPASLAALERGDYAALPGDFYTRAFLRTYATHLGLSPQALLDEYESERPPALPPPEQPAWQGSVQHATSQLAAAATSTGVVIALVVALLALAVSRNNSNEPRPAESGAVGTTGNGASAPAPARATAPAPAVTAAPEKLTIDIQAAGALWVTGAADGKRVLYRLLAPGERVTVHATDNLAFRVGDASAFTYSINGVAGKPLGGAGEVRDLEITRENYRSYTR